MKTSLIIRLLFLSLYNQVLFFVPWFTEKFEVSLLNQKVGDNFKTISARVQSSLFVEARKQHVRFCAGKAAVSFDAKRKIIEKSLHVTEKGDKYDL